MAYKNEEEDFRGKPKKVAITNADAEAFIRARREDLKQIEEDKKFTEKQELGLTKDQQNQRQEELDKIRDMQDQAKQKQDQQQSEKSQSQALQDQTQQQEIAQQDEQKPPTQSR